MKRMLDPKLRSNQLHVVDGRFVGADERRWPGAQRPAEFDYDAPIEGLQALDRYTLRFRLSAPDYELLANLTTPASRAVAREVVEAYGDAAAGRWRTRSAPGRTGSRSGGAAQKIVLEANPGFRDERYPPPSERPGRPRASRRSSTARKLPLIGRIEISIIEEAQPAAARVRASGELDYLTVPARTRPKVLDAERPAARRNLAQARRAPAARVAAGDRATLYFNMEDPVVGGYTPEQASRCAARSRMALQHRRGHPHHPPGPGDAGDAGGAAGDDRPRPGASRHGDLRPGRRRGRCSTGSATATATATACASCPTAGRWC